MQQQTLRLKITKGHIGGGGVGVFFGRGREGWQCVIKTSVGCDLWDETQGHMLRVLRDADTMFFFNINPNES